MKKKILKPIATIVTVLLYLTCFAFLADTQQAMAFTVVGEECGLRARLSEGLVPTDHLNPDDTLQSGLVLSNINTSSLAVTLKGKITRNSFGLGGGDLNKKLIITVSDGQTILYQGSIGGMSNPIPIGSISPGSMKELVFWVHLPAETDNDYQGASLAVLWTVTGSCIETGGSPGNYEKQRNQPTPEKLIPEPEEEIYIEDEKIPLDSDEISEGDEEIEEEIIIEDEPIPFGFSELPRTGGVAPMVFYFIGGVTTIYGIYLVKKKNPSKLL